MDEPNLQTIPRPVEYSFQLSQESGTPGGCAPGEGDGGEGGGEGGGGGGGGGDRQLLAVESATAGEERRHQGRTVTMHFNLRNAFVAPPG